MGDIMTTTSISGSDFGKAGNYICTDESLQKYYWEILTKKFDDLCREKGSTAWIELDLAEVYYEVGDKTEIDFYKVMREAKEYAFYEAMNRSESGDYK